MGRSQLSKRAKPIARRLTPVFFVFGFFISSMIPFYGPWVLEVQAAQKLEFKAPKPLTSAEQKQEVEALGGVTSAAKDTAVPLDDPVTAYQKAQERAKSQPDSHGRIIPNSEIKEKRTAFSQTYLNTEGGETMRVYAEPINYKPSKDAAWEPIAGTLKQDAKYNASESSKESLLSQILPGKPFVKQALKQEDGFLRTIFKSLAEDDGITVSFDGTASFNVTLLGANEQTNPELGTFEDGLSYTLYKNAWKNADVYYEQRGPSLKETIVLNSKDTQTSFGFRFKGAKLSYGVDSSGIKDGTIVAILDDGAKVVIPQLTIFSKQSGPLEQPNIRYELIKDSVFIVMDPQWFEGIPADKFPIIIDPTYDYRGVSTGIPGGDLGQFIAYDSRGYRCNSNVCDIYTGSLNDYGWKNWRSMMRLPLTSVYGQSVSWANIYTERVNRPNAWNGFNGNRPYEITWAHCFGYHCFSGAPRASTWLDWAGNFDSTALMQWVSQNYIGDGWLMIKAINEGDIYSFKSFAGSRTYLDVNFRHWNQQSALPTMAEPAQNATVVASRPTLKVNPVSDPDGDLIRYAFHLLDSKGRIVAHSGELDIHWWTIPDNILEDGETYSWRAFVMERNSGNSSIVESGWRQQPEVRSFKFDLRTGKDKTQTYDEVGPLSVSLNRGNGYTGTETHKIGALGGSIGLGLDYNTPGLTRYGLTGYYYNETSSGRRHAITVNDANVDMAWGTGSPYPGTMQTDNFTINWQGYFIAPEDGSYTFGSGRDDQMSMSITVDGVVRPQFDYGCCGWSWATTSVPLKKGQAYPISVWYFEAVGYAAAHLNVRLPNGTEQRVPTEWLRTLADAGTDESRGLAARFYKNEDTAANPNYVINDKTPLVFTTKVPTLNSDWGSGSLVPYDVGVYQDFMIANYSGYITIPADGKYQIGGGSDDGLRIRLGGKEVASRWMPQGYTETWSAEMEFKAGQILPVSVDYFEVNGAARANLQWKSSTNSVATGIIPGQYLSTSPRVVPRGWSLSVDPDSNIPYEVLQAKSSGNVDLIDSDGFVHTYTWSQGGFKPPVNEDGYLIRNADGTYTLTDTDGRVYNFSVEGLIMRVSSPVDDRSPSALQYEYRNTSTTQYGALPKLNKIMDGVDPSNRYGQVYYWGEEAASGVCSVASGFDQPSPGYLCAFKTFPDSKVTKFHYKGGQLTRVEQPGNQLVDYAYESDGRLKQVRDPLANDVVGVNLRAADGTETTQITYDSLFRITKVLLPAPFGSAVPAGQSNNRIEHTFEYGSQSSKRHITGLSGSTEPAGYQQYIEYDGLYRTTKACNNEGLCNTSEYHPQKDLLMSFVDSQGLKSTTVYDGDDRAVTHYGPAPVSSFKADRTPIDPTQVPQTVTRYDENIVGAAVSWYDFRNTGFVGAPRLHTTGFNKNSPSTFWLDSSSAGSPVAPIAPGEVGTVIGFSAESKVYVSTTGTYTLGVNHEDAVRVWVNDNLVLDDWAYRSDTVVGKSVQVVLDSTKGNRVRFDYANASGGRMAFSMDLSGNGISTPGAVWGSIMRPSYNLQTSQTVYDTQLGNKTNTVSFGTTPELGLPISTTNSGGGLSATATTEYEPAGTPGTSFLRKTSNTLPGGTKTQYTYYGTTEEMDNPCTTEVEKIRQGGMLRSSAYLDVDGSGPLAGLATSTIYDEAGRSIASRVGDDPWTCTKYDARGRTTEVIIPDRDGRAGRTITYEYAINGNPLNSSMTDTAVGTVYLETDLLGRALKATDTFGYITTVKYDAFGRVSEKQSIKGTETSTLDGYGRPTSYALDGVIYAQVAYDNLGRVASVEYPQSTNGTSRFKLSQVKRDASQQNTGSIYTFSDGTIYDETVIRTVQTGLVTGNSITLGGKTASSAYQYDGLGRLTSATVDNWKYDYTFGEQDESCGGLPNMNPNASKNGNRTRGTITNVLDGISTSTISCYNLADQLVRSSDEQIGAPTYDKYGNVTELAGAGMPIKFSYNASGQNVAIEQGGNKVEYVKDSGEAVLTKKEYRNGSLDKIYRNAAGALLTCNVNNPAECVVVDRYVALPGGVAMTLTNTSATEVKATYSVQNFHGDTAMTVGANGLPTSSISLYDPFGGKVASATFGTNSSPQNASDSSMGWATSPTRKQETMFSIAIMQMGARVYLPSLGRFLQVDPTPGGTPSAYVYVLDPINFADYNGQWGMPKWMKVALVVVVVAVVVVGVVAACIAVCAAAAAAIATAAASISASAATAAITAAGFIATKGQSIVAGVNNAIRGAKAANTVSKGATAAQNAARASAPSRSIGPGPTASANYKSSMSTGRAAHSEFDAIVKRAGGTPNKQLSPTKLRPDGQFSNGNVWELKPGNPRGVNLGEKQLQKYMDISGGNGQLWLYNQNANGTFNFWLHGSY